MTGTDEARPVRHFLIPVDDSPEALKALKWLLSHVYRQGDIIDLVHVIADTEKINPNWLGIYESTALSDQTAEKHTMEALQMIDSRLGTTLREANATYRVHILQGSVSIGGISEKVIEKAESLQCDAILIGHHREPKVKKFFIGSIAQELLKTCTLPIVVI